MNLLTFLLSLALLSVGVAGGMAFGMIFSKTRIKELEEQNRQLRADVRYLKRLKKDTVEIIYPHKEPDSYFTPF